MPPRANNAITGKLIWISAMLSRSPANHGRAARWSSMNRAWVASCGSSHVFCIPFPSSEPSERTPKGTGVCQGWRTPASLTAAASASLRHSAARSGTAVCRQFPAASTTRRCPRFPANTRGSPRTPPAHSRCLPVPVICPTDGFFQRRRRQHRFLPLIADYLIRQLQLFQCPQYALRS